MYYLRQLDREIEVPANAEVECHIVWILH